MSIKGFFKTNQIEDIQNKIELLEKQYKKINTFEVYIKRFMKLEQNVELIKLKERRRNEEGKKNQENIENNREMERRVYAKIETGQIQKKFAHMEQKFMKLEREFLLLQNQYKEKEKEMEALKKEVEEHKIFPNNQPVIFQEVHIDKLVMDKYEQNNNLGQLGINNLNGKLNIGASYDKGVIPYELAEEWKENMEKLNKEKEKEEKD
ncbi:hypothetical protein [Metabacillus fastidiosus]|uniref:hypothetical protein n=1 Tax=Metabacillus fastidiosus TaxID=1458 RepID=UPI002E1E7A72|nr:hypothetical protein [Metabacillus fastidiosus]